MLSLFISMNGQCQFSLSSDKWEKNARLTHHIQYFMNFHKGKIFSLKYDNFRFDDHSA